MKRIFQTILSLLMIVMLLSACNFKIPESIQALDNIQASSEPNTEEQPAQNQSVSPQVVTLTDPEALQNAYNDIFDQVSPSVVHIQVTSLGKSEAQQLPDFPFSLPNGAQPENRMTQSSGSGFVWNKEGIIVTNHHVIDGAQKIIVEFSDGLRVEAKLIGSDPASDLGVIQVDVDEASLVPVTLADSTQVRTGDIAIAIGNPFGLQNTMTVGIVSALGRSLPSQVQTGPGAGYTIPDVIQTDAPINPGNSGGVLVNLGGQVIGVPSAIESTSGANAGIGFVIPSIIVNKVVPAILDHGSYDHPWIGISGGSLRSEVAEKMGLPATQHGALVNEVIQGSPADLAGLKGSDKTVKIDEVEVNIGGDIITAIDGNPVNDFEDLVAYLARYTDVGQTIQLTLLRDGNEIQLELTLASRDENKQMAGTPWLGVQITDLTPDLAHAAGLDKNQNGVLIVQITSQSPAEKAGLKGSYKSVEINGETVLIGGDIITHINGNEVEAAEQVIQIISDSQVGDTLTLTLLREGDEMELPVTLEAKP